MDHEKKKFLRRSILLLLAGLLVFVVYLVFFVPDLGQIISDFQRVNPWVYVLTFVASSLDTFFFAMAWRYLMKSLSIRISIRKAYAFMWVSTFFDSLVPAQSVSGEISRVYLMSKEPNPEPGKVVCSLIAHRVINSLITISTLLIGVIMIFVSGYSLPTIVMYFIWLVTIATVAFLVLVLVLLVKEKWTERIVDAFLRFFVRIFRGRWRLEELRERVLVELRRFYDGLAILTDDPKHFIAPVIFSLISWFFSMLVTFLVFVCLGFAISWNLVSLVIVVFSLSFMIKNVPLGVPEVGLPEIVMSFLYGPYGLGAHLGITTDIAAAITILSRLASFWFKFVVGFVVTQWVGLKTVMEGMKLGQKDEV